MRKQFHGLALAFSLLLVAGSTPGVASEATPADSAIRAVLADLDRYEPEIARLTPDRTANIKRLQRSLDLTEQRLRASPNQADPSWQAANGRLVEARARLQALGAAAGQPAVPSTGAAAGAAAPATAATATGDAASRLTAQDQIRLDRVRGNIDALVGSLEGLAAMELQQPAERQVWQGRVQRSRQDIDAFAGLRGVGEVDAALAAMTRAEQLYAERVAEADRQLAELGDVTGRFAAIEARYTGSGKLPEILRDPASPQDVAAWGQAFLAFRTSLQQDGSYLQDIGGRTTLISRQDHDRLSRWVNQELPPRLERIEAETMGGVDRRIAALMQPLAFMADVKPGDSGKITNLYLNSDTYAQRLGEMDEVVRLLDTALQLDRMLGFDTAGHEQRKAELAALRGRIEATMEAALADARMPPNRGDAGLAAIAEEVLKTPTYGVGSWQRLVVNAPKVRHAERRFEAEGSSLVAYDMVWEQFQVATAEPEGDQLFVYYNTLKFFESGYRTTPTGRWILAERFKGGRILPENLAK